MEAQIPLLIANVILLSLVIILTIRQYRQKLPLATRLRAIRRKTNIEEKRTHPRHKTSLRIKYKTPSEEGTLQGKSWIKDISRGGMRLFLDKDIENGTFLTLEISLPFDKLPVFAQSSLVWKEGDDAGLIFDEVEEKDLDRILEYIDQRAQINSLNV